MPRAGPCSRLPPGPCAGCPPGTPPPWSSSAASRSPPRAWRPRPAPAPIRTATPGTAEYRRRASPRTTTPGRYRPRAVPGRLAVPHRAGVRQARPGGRLRGRLHADQPPPGAHDPPSGRRAVLPPRPRPLSGRCPPQSPPGGRRRPLRGHHAGAAADPATQKGPADGRPLGLLPGRSCRGGRQRPRRRPRRPAARRRCPCSPVRAAHPALPLLRPEPPGGYADGEGYQDASSGNRCACCSPTSGPRRASSRSRVRPPMSPAAWWPMPARSYAVAALAVVGGWAARKRSAGPRHPWTGRPDDDSATTRPGSRAPARPGNSTGPFVSACHEPFRAGGGMSSRRGRPGEPTNAQSTEAPHERERRRSGRT